MGATVSCALVCEYCCFDTAPRFVEATTKTLRFVDCRLPGFNGARMRMEGIFNLYRTTVATVLRLDRAKVAGEVCLRAAIVGEATGTEAIAADGLAVEGDLDCREMISRGPVRMRRARVSGSVYLAGAQASCQQHPALNAGTAVIGGGFDGTGLLVEGETRLRHTRITGSLELNGARLHNPAGDALSAGGLTVEGGVWCAHGFSAIGEVRLIGARLGANLTFAGAELSNPRGPALNLDRATLADLDAADLVVSAGSVSLISVQIASRVNLSGARLNCAQGTLAFAADGATIGAALILARAQVRGEVMVRTSRVGGRVLLQDIRIENPGGTGLRMSRTEVAADVFCGRMTVTGEVKLTGAQIGRHLDLKQVRLINSHGVALDARALQAAEVTLLPAEPIQGTVNLSHARIGILRDDPQSWPDQLRLDGLSYDALEPQLPAQRRLSWLGRDPGHSPQPYEQLAALYTKIGQPAEARRVLYAAERRKRITKTVPGRVWSVLQDITVGYGYRPSRAASWLAAFLVIGSVTYAAVPPPPLGSSGAPHFNPVIYTLDLLLPVVDLGQKHAFNPGGAEQWFSYVLVAAGWLLATTIATGIARVITRR